MPQQPETAVAPPAQDLPACQAAQPGTYRVDPDCPNEVLLRDSRGRLLETIEVRLIYPLGVPRRPGEVCDSEKHTARRIAAALNTDYRALQVALLRERAQIHRGEAMTLECSAGFLSAEQRATVDWHERQARALHHEAELIDKAPDDRQGLRGTPQAAVHP